MTGGASGFGLACEGALPVLAINLRQPPRRNLALLTLRIGAASGAIVITRNGTTNVWGAAVRDPRVLNALASGQSVALAVDGVSYGSVPLTGAGEAMREALGGCWAGAATQQGADRAARSANGSSRAPEPATDNMPVQLANDIADFDQTCRDGFNSQTMGRAVLMDGAIQRADFNSDGIADYLFDGTKIHCSRQNDNRPYVMAVYSSASNGKFIRSLSYGLTGAVAIVKGARTALRVHQPGGRRG